MNTIENIMKCPICGKEKIIRQYKNDETSLCRYGLMPTRSSALAVPKNLKLEILECKYCDFAWNTKFEPSKVNYSNLPILESALHSPKYLDFQKDQALWLSKILKLENKSILEIGGGSGYFMKHINANKRIIYEPSLESSNISSDIKVYKKYFNPSNDKIEGEIIVMRQVLEHIPQPFLFLNSIIEKSSFPKGYIYIEVPSYNQSKAQNRFYDFYYEHCNYFSLNSFAKISLLLNTNIISLGSHFNNELNICLMEYDKKVETENLFLISRENISSKITTLLGSGRRIALWGASGNGVALLNELNIDYNSIPYVIDDDERKQGQYIPFTGQKIISSKSIYLEKIDCIFIASQLHSEAIASKCHKKFGSRVRIYNLQGEKVK